MIDLSFILQHGWALDASMWSGWTDRLLRLDKSVQVQIADSGYFNRNSLEYNFPENSRRKVLIAHSYGLHLIPVNVLKDCDLLVLIGSFTTFHQGTDKEQKLSRLKLKSMLRRFAENPEAVLSEFYRNCDFNVEFADSLLQADLELSALSEHLRALDKCSISSELLHSISQVLILHGEADKIVPADFSQTLHQKLSNSQRRVACGEGHALPQSNPRWCIEQIEGVLPGVIRDLKMEVVA